MSRYDVIMTLLFLCDLNDLWIRTKLKLLWMSFARYHAILAWGVDNVKCLQELIKCTILFIYVQSNTFMYNARKKLFSKTGNPIIEPKPSEWIVKRAFALFMNNVHDGMTKVNIGHFTWPWYDRKRPWSLQCFITYAFMSIKLYKSRLVHLECNYEWDKVIKLSCKKIKIRKIFELIWTFLIFFVLPELALRRLPLV